MDTKELQQLFRDGINERLLDELKLINLQATKELVESPRFEHITIESDETRRFFKGMWLIVTQDNKISVVDNPQRPTRTESSERFSEHRYDLEKIIPEISGLQYTEKECMNPQKIYYLV